MNEKKLSYADFLESGGTKDLYGKLKSTDFINRLEKAAVADVMKKRGEALWELALSPFENEKRFKQKVRQNSRKYHKKAMSRAKNECEFCLWNIDSRCLNIHHIVPVNDYWLQLYNNNSYLSKDAELSNLVVLCPNCHAFVHFYISQESEDERKKAMSEFFSHTNIKDEKIDILVTVLNKQKRESYNLFDRRE